MVRAFIALELSDEINERLAAASVDAPRVPGTSDVCGAKEYSYNGKVPWRGR